ncbi:MAG TPA: hypothetical protein VFN87_13430 [Solirubrobacteraceae bacterium]|nr:hypothetical protein [Solirubrobacteraceae bacterium]
MDEEQLAELIAALPPAPEGWVRAAIELPGARAAIEGLTARAAADSEARAAMLADLERALRGAGVEPGPGLLDVLRARLRGLTE